MTLIEITTIVNNKLNTLKEQLDQSVQHGNLERCLAIENEIKETELILQKLKS